MSAIRLKSEFHGFTHVYSEAEAVAMEKHGWSRCEEAPVVVAKAVEVKEVTEVPLEAQYEAKFGKKPHHRVNLAKALSDDSK
jgi:hypothetical protein